MLTGYVSNYVSILSKKKNCITLPLKTHKPRHLLPIPTISNPVNKNAYLCIRKTPRLQRPAEKAISLRSNHGARAGILPRKNERKQHKTVFTKKQTKNTKKLWQSESKQ